MILKLTNFQGTFPLVAPHLLPDNAAQVASNVVLDSGDIMPLRDGSIVTDGNDGPVALRDATTSVYWYLREHWLSWSAADVNVVPSPVTADAGTAGSRRLYWTDGVGKPQVSDYNTIITQGTGAYPRGSRDLGVAAPGESATPTATLPPSYIASNQDRSFAYVYTRVTELGEESAPSLASEVISALDGTTITVANFSQGGDTNVTYYKLYRTNMGTNGTDWQAVDTMTVYWTNNGQEVSEVVTDGRIRVGASKITEHVQDLALGALLRTQGWDVPPPALAGLVGHPAGFMAGFVGKTVYVSVAYMPHAWPYTYTFYEDIVGLATYGQSILVLTEGSPYTLTGVDPSALSQERLESGFACVSKRSIVDMGDNIVYASPYGLVSVNTDSIKLVTNEHLSKRDFAGLLPANHADLHAYCHDRKYVAFGTPSDTGKYPLEHGFVFDFIVNALSTHQIEATCAYSDDVTGQMFYVQNSANTSVLRQWDNGRTKSATWKSKVVYLPGHLNFTGCRVLADSYVSSPPQGREIVLTVACQVGDAVRSDEYAVAGTEPFTLKGGFTGTRYEFTIESIHRVRSVELFNDVSELFNG